MLLYTYRPNHDGAYIQCTLCGSQYNEDRHGSVTKKFLSYHVEGVCNKPKDKEATE